jgi:hypothetical protein
MPNPRSDVRKAELSKPRYRSRAALEGDQLSQTTAKLDRSYPRQSAQTGGGRSSGSLRRQRKTPAGKAGVLRLVS